MEVVVQSTWYWGRWYGALTIAVIDGRPWQQPDWSELGKTPTRAATARSERLLQKNLIEVGVYHKVTSRRRGGPGTPITQRHGEINAAENG